MRLSSVNHYAPTLRFHCTIRFCVSYAFARNIVGCNIIYEFSVLLFHGDSRADVKYRMRPQNGTNCWLTWCPLFTLPLISRTLFTLSISHPLSFSLVYVLFPIVVWLSLMKFPGSDWSAGLSFETFLPEGNLILDISVIFGIAIETLSC